MYKLPGRRAADYFEERTDPEMTIEELQRKLESIPPRGAVNLARRMAIIILINQLMEQENVE